MVQIQLHNFQMSLKCISSFVYIKNNSGPKQEPWGTPNFRSKLPYLVSFINMCCDHSVK